MTSVMERLIVIAYETCQAILDQHADVQDLSISQEAFFTVFRDETRKILDRENGSNVLQSSQEKKDS